MLLTVTFEPDHAFNGNLRAGPYFCIFVLLRMVTKLPLEQQQRSSASFHSSSSVQPLYRSMDSVESRKPASSSFSCDFYCTLPQQHIPLSYYNHPRCTLLDKEANDNGGKRQLQQQHQQQRQSLRHVCTKLHFFRLSSMESKFAAKILDLAMMLPFSTSLV
jgi:hypothetical protein